MLHVDEFESEPSMLSARCDEVRLVLISEVFYPELPGGLMRFFRYGPLLRERGIDVHVFTVKRTHHVEDQFEENGIFIHRVPADQCNNRDEERRFIFDEALRWQQGQEPCPTVFQMMATLGPKGAWGIWKARMLGIPTVYALTIIAEPPPQALLPSWRFRLRAAFALAPYRRFFSLSQRMKELFTERLGIRSGRFDVIPNGVDLQRFCPAEEGEQAKERDLAGIPANAKVVLCVGALVERKRVDVLLEAWADVLKQVPEAFLLIVGAQQDRPSHDTPKMQQAFDQYSQRVRSLAEQQKLRQAVRIDGESVCIEKVYHLADVFVLPSRLEGMPNVLLEAMASGLPAVVNGFEGLPRNGEELGNEGQHFLRCDGGAAEWAESLVSLLQAEAQGEQMGKFAREWMLQHHGIEWVVDKLNSKYREIAGG